MPCLDMPRQKVVPGPGCLVSLQFCSWHTKQIHAMCFEFAPGAWFLLPCCITCSSLPLYELGKLDFDPLGSDSIRFQHVDAVTSPWCFWIGAIWALLLVFLGKATGPTWTKSPGAIDAVSPEPTPWAVVWWSISDGYMMINGIISISVKPSSSEVWFDAISTVKNTSDDDPRVDSDPRGLATDSPPFSKLWFNKAT